MDQVLSFLRVVIQLLPLIVQAVQAIEAAIPQTGVGAQKLAAVKSLLEGAVNATNQIGPTFEQLWPTIEKVVGAVVAGFNATGVFKKA